jgi:predicted metalloprotease with PDZ domain
MRKSLLFLLFSISLLHVYAQHIHYKLSMPKPQNHYFEVEMELRDFKEKTLSVKMPVWAPGSYLVREFAKNVNLVKASDENGTPIKVTKKNKNTWDIERGKAAKVTVKYEVYAFELSVRTSFLDLTHGFVSGTSVFMYVDGHINRKGTLEVVPYKDFEAVTTSLPAVSFMSGFHYAFDSYDQLADCPIEIGNQEVFDFTAAGVHHTVAMYGEGNYEVDRLKEDMSRIVETATAVFGENPNKEYVFIIHNVVDGQGGLEHTNSTTLSVNRWSYGSDGYIGFLSLVAHEYFHLWNVKRLRPIELGPFNYDEENYTSLLWVMEGFTSYYDELLLRRAGYISESEYLGKLQSSLNYVEGSPGARVQPVAHASFDAWIKAYRPNENSGNTTMTYYSRGAVLAAVIDAMIIAKTNGSKCLDHFMTALYTKFYKKQNRGFTEDEFKKELELFLQEDMTDFFNRYIGGTEILPYAMTFGAIGVSVEDQTTNKPSFGATLKQEGGKVIIRSVRSGSAAEDAGLSVNDEIIGCNGYRVNQAALEATMNSLGAGETAELLISRDEVLYSITVNMTNFVRPQFKLKLDESSPKKALWNYWLRAQP